MLGQAEHHLARSGGRGAVRRMDRRCAPEPRRHQLQPAGLQAFARRSNDRSSVYKYERNEPAQLARAGERSFRGNLEAWDFFNAQAPWHRRTAIAWGDEREEGGKPAPQVGQTDRGFPGRPLDRAAGARPAETLRRLIRVAGGPCSKSCDPDACSPVARGTGRATHADDRGAGHEEVNSDGVDHPCSYRHHCDHHVAPVEPPEGRRRSP